MMWNQKDFWSGNPCESVMTSNNPEYQATEQAFFSAIAENPHDLTNWLIFADFLEDHCHPCAEITRLWATRRFGSTPLSEQEQARLDALFTSGLGPYLPRHSNSIGMELVLVPSGTFWMSEAYENAKRQVEIPDNFYMGIYPVTQEQWQTIMGNNPSYFSRTGGGQDEVKGISDGDLKQFPVETVSWEDVQKFLEEFNRQEKSKSGWLYRLPTKAEWEYTCRGGATSKADCAFDFYLSKPTNDLSADQANFHGNDPAGNASKGQYLERPTKVGSYQPNALGLFDMHGNVGEWCQDWDEEGPPFQMIRGGSWASDAEGCRAAALALPARVGLGSGIGFRLALVPSGK